MLHGMWLEAKQKQIDTQIYILSDNLTTTAQSLND